MKNIRSILATGSRKTQAIGRQLELALPGSRLTRDEADFLAQIRQLRAQILAKAA